MHVIMKKPLVDFWIKHPEAEKPLQAWCRLMESNVFTDFNHLKTVFGSADYVNELTVFDIGGNKYRLIVSIHYNRRKVFVRDVLTHAEYDRNTWKRKN